MILSHSQKIGVDFSQKEARLKSELDKHKNYLAELTTREEQLTVYAQDLVDMQLQFEEEKKESVKKIEERKLHLENLRKKVQDKEKEVENQTSILKSQEREIDILKQKASAAETEIATKSRKFQTERQKETARQLISQLQKLKNEYQMKLQGLGEMRQVEEMKKKEVAEEELKLQSLKYSVTSLDDELKQMAHQYEEEKNDLAAQFSEQLKLAEAAKAESSQLQEIVKKLEKEEAELNVKIKFEEEKLMNLETELRQKQARSGMYEDEIDKVRSNTKKSKIEFDKLTEKLSAKSSKMKEDLSKISQLEQTLLLEKNLLNEIQNQIDRYRDEFNRTQSRIILLNERISSKKESNEGKVSDLDALREALLKQKAEFTLIVEHNKALKRNELDDKKQITELEEKLQEVQLDSKLIEGVIPFLRTRNSYKNNTSSDEIDINGNPDVSLQALQLMEQCHLSMQNLRMIRREKVNPEHRALLDVIEEREDKLIQLHKTFLKLQ